MSVAVVESARLETTDLTPRIGAKVITDVETLLSGRYAKQIRELLDRRSRIPRTQPRLRPAEGIHPNPRQGGSAGQQGGHERFAGQKRQPAIRGLPAGLLALANRYDEL